MSTNDRRDTNTDVCIAFSAIVHTSVRVTASPCTILALPASPLPIVSSTNQPPLVVYAVSEDGLASIETLGARASTCRKMRARPVSLHASKLTLRTCTPNLTILLTLTVISTRMH